MLKRILALTLCALMILGAFTGCSSLKRKSNKEKIKDTIKQFQKAYNAGDFDAVIECLSYQKRTAMESTIKLYESLLGKYAISPSILFGIAPEVVADDDMLKLAVKEIDIDNDKATVKVEGTFNTKYEDKYYEGDFILVKEDGDWFIDDLELDPVTKK